MKKKKAPKIRNHGTMTEAAYNAWIMSGLRRMSVKWRPKNEAFSLAYVGKKINKYTGRRAKHYKCAGCGEHFPFSKVCADHIDPVIDPSVGFTTWDDCIDRLFIEVDGYQILCKEGCHLKKTNEERKIAKERRL